MAGRRTFRWAAALLAATTCALAGSAAGVPSNLLTNGTFDTIVTPWTGASWKVLDAAGSPGSGSARVTNAQLYEYDNWAYGQQCIDAIATGGSYRLSGQAMVPSDQPRLLGVGIDTQGFSEPGCRGNGSLGGTDALADLGMVDVWQSLSVTTTYPPAARSVRVYMEVGKRGATGLRSPADDVWARFDNIVFVPAGTAGPFRLVIPAVARD